MLPNHKFDRGALAVFFVVLLSIVLVVWISQAQTENGFNPWNDTYAEIVSAVATIAGTFISLFALLYLVGTWKEAKRGAEAAWKATEHSETTAQAAIAAAKQAEKTNKIAEINAVADRRPWLSMQIEPVGGIKFEKNGYMGIEVLPKITNLGRTPALQVNFAIKAIAFSNFDQAIEQYNEFCDKQMVNSEPTRAPWQPARSFGRTIFPTQEWASMKHGIPVSSTEIEEHKEDLFAKLKDKKEKSDPDFIVRIALFCVVTYSFTGSDQYHQTAQFFEVWGTIEDETKYIEPSIDTDSIFLLDHSINAIAN